MSGQGPDIISYERIPFSQKCHGGKSWDSVGLRVWTGSRYIHRKLPTFDGCLRIPFPNKKRSDPLGLRVRMRFGNSYYQSIKLLLPPFNFYSHQLSKPTLLPIPPNSSCLVIPKMDPELKFVEASVLACWLISDQQNWIWKKQKVNNRNLRSWMIGWLGRAAPCCVGEHSGIRPQPPLLLILAPPLPHHQNPPCLLSKPRKPCCLI